jgi:hypothetical protein
MKINKKIKEILREFNIDLDLGLLYLLSLHYKLKTLTFFPNNVKRRIHSTGIISIGKEGIIWNIELFQNNHKEDNFLWVKTEYVKLFKDKNREKGGKVREATLRMKTFFSENPEIRKDDVINATKMYLGNTDANYIRFPHYFIKKGKGTDVISDLLDWIDKLKESQVESNFERNSTSNTMK